MDTETLFTTLENNTNQEQALKMSAYMRNQFPFLGIPTPLRKTLCKPYFKTAKAEMHIDWAFVLACWDKPWRELQYVAVDYLTHMKQHLLPEDIPLLKNLVLSKSWWDTIDGLDRLLGALALAYPQVKETLIQWSLADNFWLRRIAIDHQLLQKEQTDTQLLATIIKNNFGEKEFFINKAIGWSLRDYSKTNPQWVRHFLEEHINEMAPLSVKEASKYL